MKKIFLEIENDECPCCGEWDIMCRQIDKNGDTIKYDCDFACPYDWCDAWYTVYDLYDYEVPWIEKFKCNACWKSFYIDKKII